MSAQTKALLVSLNFTLPRQSIQLRNEAEDVEDKAKAKRGTVKATLSYFQKKDGNNTIDALAKVKSFMNEWRAEHNKLTKPWDNNNTRLLPASLASKHQEMTDKYKSGLSKVVEEFLNEYPEWEKDAPERLGDLFDKAKFPTVQEAMYSIGAHTSYFPIPAVEQIKRINDISPDVIKTMEESTNELVQKAVEEARKQTWVDAMAPIKHLFTELSKPDKKKFHKSLINNISEAASKIKDFNQTFNDPALDKLADKVQATLSKIDPNDLKSEATQEKAISESKNIIDEFEPYLRAFNLEPETKND